MKGRIMSGGLAATAARGTGRVDDPIRAENGLCAFKGCPNAGGFVRVTSTGYFVSYCRQHELDADRAFEGKGE